MPGPLVLDLVAALVATGAPPSTALRTVDEALRSGKRAVPSVAGDRASREPAAGAHRAAQEAVSLAERAGLPPTALLRRAAVEERRRCSSAQMRAIRRLEVLLVIPAGVCLLPAFVLIGVAPLVIDLFGG